MTIREEIVEYCNTNGVRLTEEELDQAVNLVENEGYSIEEAVNHVDHPIKPTGQ